MKKPITIAAFRLGKKPEDMEESDDEGMDVSAEAKASAAKDLAKALGIDPASVDTGRVVRALDAYLACGPGEYDE